MIDHINNYKRVIKLSWSILLFNKTRFEEDDYFDKFC